MLLALYTIFVLGGGGTFGPMVYIDEAIDNTKTVIVDKDRQKEVTAALKEMKQRSKEYASDVGDTIKNLSPASNPHEATAEDLEAFWDEMIEQNARFSNDFLDMRFELLGQLDREEWEAIFPVQD